jgi:transposase
MAVADGTGPTLTVHAESAPPPAVTIVTDTLVETFTEQLPNRLIGDQAYDSDALDEELARAGIEMIAPHRRGRRKPPTQDGRKLRRHARRWRVERLSAWLHNNRRIGTRFDYYIENYLGFVHLGCISMLLNAYL